MHSDDAASAEEIERQITIIQCDCQRLCEFRNRLDDIALSSADRILLLKSVDLQLGLFEQMIANSRRSLAMLAKLNSPCNSGLK